MTNTPPIVSIIGKKKSGKTTTLVALAAELSRRGRKVATIKHSHGFTIDHEGRDSWRHRHEGHAIRTAIVTDSEFALLGTWQDERALSPVDLAQRYFMDADVVLVEGFRLENLPSIEVFRRAAHERSWYEQAASDRPEYIAVTTDDPTFVAEVPTFDMNDPATIAALADLVEQRLA